MIREKAQLSLEKETLLITLYAKALDSGLPTSLLHDRFAANLVDRIDEDFERLQVDVGTAQGVALRAKSFDVWTRAFLAREFEATVLHLGCGLDSRILRVDPPPHVRWFEIDFPDVIDLRRRLYPEREGCSLIGCSVTDPAWLSDIPRDRPAMIVAEGLMPYLGPTEPQLLIERLVSCLPAGEIVFDAYSRLGVRLLSFNPSIRATGATLRWALDDPTDLIADIPKLELVEETLAHDLAELERIAPAFGIVLPLWNLIPYLRRIGRLLRYRF